MVGEVVIALGTASGIVGAMVAAVSAARIKRRRSLDRWREAARTAGLTDVRFGSWFGPEVRLTGKAGPLTVRVESLFLDRNEAGFLAVDGLGHLESEISFSVEDVGAQVSHALGHRDIEIGDLAFDRVVWLHGSPVLAHALFDAETRKALLGMIEGVFANPGSRSNRALGGINTSLSNGTLRLGVDGQRTSLDDLASVLPAVMAAARRLVRPAQLVPPLARNAGQDPVAGVRQGCLRLLVEHHPNHPLTRETLRGALSDPLPDIRLQAAFALGEEARPVLLALATNDDSPDLAAARAIAALGEGLSAEEVEPLLAQALRRRRTATARACLMRLGALGSVGRLARVLAVERGELARVAAEALATTGSAEAEEPLLAALERDDPALRLAVVRALGEVGTAAAVAPMRQALAGPPAAAGLDAAVKEAIGRIQSRLTGAEAGQLSIAEAEGGQLSLAEPGANRRPGALSLAEKA